MLLRAFGTFHDFSSQTRNQKASLPLIWASNVAALPSSATTLWSGCVNVGACVAMMVGTLRERQMQSNDYCLFIMTSQPVIISKILQVMGWIFLAVVKLNNHCNDTPAADWRAACHLKDQWLHGVWVLGQTFASSIDWQLTDMTVTTGAFGFSVTSFTMTFHFCHLPLALTYATDILI